MRKTFRWFVPNHGYRWIKKKKKKGRFWHLTESTPIGPPRPGKFYYPLVKYTGLHREFIKLEPTQDAVMGFANRYGWLGLQDQPLEVDGKLHLAETLNSWGDNIGFMRILFDLHQNTRAENTKALGKVIHWTDRNVQFIDDRGKAGGVIASADVNPALYESLRRGEILKPARHYLVMALNRHLAEKTELKFLYDNDQVVKVNMPLHLLGALWLQFGNAISGNREYRECAWCGRDFEISPGVSRRDRKTCSTACRNSLSRHNRKGK